MFGTYREDISRLLDDFDRFREVRHWCHEYDPSVPEDIIFSLNAAQPQTDLLEWEWELIHLSGLLREAAEKLTHWEDELQECDEYEEESTALTKAAEKLADHLECVRTLQKELDTVKATREAVAAKLNELNVSPDIRLRQLADEKKKLSELRLTKLARREAAIVVREQSVGIKQARANFGNLDESRQVEI